MACWLSPRAIIWVKPRRCWSRKQSSGLRFSMAALRALLSRITAPRTERSASRLLGSGFSRVASEGMRLLLFRFSFAYDNTSLCVDARAPEKLSGGEDYSGLDLLPVCCYVIVERIVRGSGARVNWSGCARFRKMCKSFFVRETTRRTSSFVCQALDVEVLSGKAGISDRTSSLDVLRMTALPTKTPP